MELSQHENSGNICLGDTKLVMSDAHEEIVCRALTQSPRGLSLRVLVDQCNARIQSTGFLRILNCLRITVSFD